MYAVVFLLVFIIRANNAFFCPSPNGTSVNPDDYRSYYVCTNYCYRLEYCLSPTIYFTRINQSCIPEPPDWRTRYDLSGQFKSNENTGVFIQQQGYTVTISHETSTAHYLLIARYINETHAIGIQTIHRLVNHCIVVLDVRIVATNNRAHCFYGTFHPLSSKCDLPETYSGNYFLFYYIIGINTFDCPNSNGIYINPDDYRSFYVCNNYCPRFEYCKSPNLYFSSDNQSCSIVPNNWIPRYYLTGTIPPSDQSECPISVRQDGYQLFMACDGSIISETFIGRYINETHVQGIHLRRILTTNCINVFNFQLIASADRQYCVTHSLHPQSALCDLSYPYEYTYCRTMFIGYFIFICSLFIYSTTYEHEFLPGIDDLQSGYDGVKMLSAIEQRSKFRIFNLNEKSNSSFIFKILNQEHNYTIPLLVQVTDINIRKENNCQSISYTFQQFYESYFQINTFDIGISGLNNPSFSIEYHEMLKRVYQAITKYSQVIGTSTIWWNLYSIQLVSSSLLKFDSMFNDSINLLISQAANPNSEIDQQFYNDFIQKYGTHYLSNVIVGGIAHLYTFIMENYHKNSTYEDMIQQISFTAKLKEFTFQTEEIDQNITENFKKNSYTISIFQPPIVNINNQSILQTWINNVGEQPVVISRTLSHISDLIRSNNQVQEHLRRTIDFYLSNGFLPTLVQLNSQKKMTKSYSSLPTPIRSIFGLDVVGCGYDLLTLQSRLCILDTSNSSQNELWIDPYNQSLSYSLPNGFFATNTPESLILDATVRVTSVEDYYRYTTRIETWEQVGIQDRKHVEKRTTEFYRRFYQDYYNLVLRLKQIGWYTLSVSIFPYPKLNPLAEKTFANLPSTFDLNNISIWEQFITSFGTHIVVASQMGGQVWAETWYEKCLTYEQTEIWINEQIRRSFLFFIQQDSTNQEHQRNVDQHFKQFSIYSSQLLGGTEFIEPEKWEEWAPTVKNNPKPISYRLVPLYEILPEGNQRSALQAAIEYISKTAEIENREYIAQLESVRGPPPTKCSRNRVRRAVLTTTEASQNNDQIIRDALCPYVGYDGLTCAGLTKKTTSVPIYRQLPVGVGMTIDITRGTLLLPAIELTYDNITSWQDPLTNETYWYPREVSILPVNQSENEPVAYTFLTASELENHWKYGQTRGYWLGGELGHSKPILDIQARFFSDNQAIAITQKPYVLYRLKVEQLNLNIYVKNAIRALPKVYNEIIYESFLRNWGTHIVLKSLVGGMHEQQVLFKDCVFSFNGSITPENLDQYLKQDILAETLGNSFYAERRRISVDHKLGGNPSLSNVTEWQYSLGPNPALLKIEQFTPLYEIVEDPDVKANLIRIIKNRTDTYEKQRIQEETQIMYQRTNARILALKASVGLLNGGTCEITTPVILDSVVNCSSGCSTGLKLTSPGGFTHDRPLEYVRDPATGFVQARVRLQDVKLKIVLLG
ncbi:unnamed protein product [Rotaria sordida]|uniref:MACPF domain-containing protein n=1 Tax=Rotaria sordida TaxID=392033 RepID=A0A819JD00_9BILA|nr:unnamed protein product [Rotaria sordida]